MKKRRQSAILQIIQSTDVETQNQLIEELRNAGIDSTQATISRDIKELLLVKEMTPHGVYRYAVGHRQDAQDNSTRLKAIFRESVTSYNWAQNLVVIKTLPGLAPAACSAIDGMAFERLVGTIAGDDTAFLAMTDGDAAAAFCAEIEALLR